MTALEERFMASIMSNIPQLQDIGKSLAAIARLKAIEIKAEHPEYAAMVDDVVDGL